jgi:hypothetical protein
MSTRAHYTIPSELGRAQIISSLLSQHPPAPGVWNPTGLPAWKGVGYNPYYLFTYSPCDVGNPP